MSKLIINRSIKRYSETICRLEVSVHCVYIGPNQNKRKSVNHIYNFNNKDHSVYIIKKCVIVCELPTYVS